MQRDRLSIFVSSSMAELPEERQALKVTLEAMQVDAWVWEKDAGAQSRTIRETYLDEVERADIFIGIFWRKYGLYTVEEYERARKLRKPILVYEKDVDLEARDPHLRDFLERIGRVDGDTAPGRFKTVPELEERLKNDVPRLLQQVVRGAAARPKARMAPPAHAERTVERGEILSRLRKRLLPRTPGETPPCTCAALVGMGGLGKTSLAVAFASAAAQAGSYADGLLWTQLGTEPNLPRRLSDWGLALEDLKPTQTYPDEQTASGRLSTLLSAGSYLLVIDDVWNADQLRPFLAGGSRCLHLVTTRHRDVAEAAGAEVLDVDAMTMAETLALMARWAGPIADGDLEAATWLAGEIGGLPLAVELLAAQAPTLGWQKLRQRWGSRGLELLRRGRDAKGKQNSVADSFSLSLDAMSGPESGELRKARGLPGKGPIPPRRVRRSLGLRRGQRPRSARVPPKSSARPPIRRYRRRPLRPPRPDA